MLYHRLRYVWQILFRWPCIQTFADPMQGYEDQNISGSTSTVETPNNISNGKHTPKKNSWEPICFLSLKHGIVYKQNVDAPDQPVWQKYEPRLFSNLILSIFFLFLLFWGLNCIFTSSGKAWWLLMCSCQLAKDYSLRGDRRGCRMQNLGDESSSP